MKINEIVSRVMLVVLLGLLLAGCSDEASKPSTKKASLHENDPAADPMNAEWTQPRQAGGHNQSLKNADDVTGAIHYGANVYYFPKVEDSFANSLATFILRNTNLEVTAIAPNVIRRLANRRVELDDSWTYNGNYGVAVGYFVTFRDK